MSYFYHYIPPGLIERVVDQTDLYAQQQIAKMPHPITKHARSEEWKPVTIIKMKKFLCLIFVTGIVRKPKLELYWSTREIFQTPVFPQTMSRNRSQLIQRYLHFNGNNAAGTNEDCLYKIRTILDIVVNNFRTNYIPDREISPDEGMRGWRGHLRFRVYNPGKITKCGMLVWMVCESSTGYIRNLQIYDGKCGPLTETVGFLLEPYEGKGYHLYQDNYYNSVHQTNELLQKLIRVCGTIRVNRGLLKDMIEEAKKWKKDKVTFHRNQEMLLISYQDKRLVNMISTLHTAEVIETTSRRTGVAKKKPKCIIDYNTHMHGVDTADQYLACYPFIRKTVKWPKKVFFYLLECCLFNSYVTFSKNNPNSRKSFLDFMSDFAENLIHTSDAMSLPSSSSDESQGSSRTPTPTPTKRAPRNDSPGRLDGKLRNHKLVHIPPTKLIKYQHENVECMCEKISRKKLHFSVLSVVFLCIQKAATHDITR